MREALAFAAIFTLTGLPWCAAQDSFEVKVYPAPRVRDPSPEQDDAITIDGVPDEAAWQRAPLAGGFTLFNGSGLVDVQTWFRAAYNSRFLLVAVLCDEPNIAALAAESCSHDSKEVFRGETIELFVEPRHDHGEYFQVAFNAAGSVYDSRRTSASWNSEAVVKTSVKGKQWIAEVALPWETLGVEPAQGAVLGVNVCRDRLLGQDKQWTNWSQTVDGFHDPVRFGHLVLSPTPSRLAALAPEFRRGGRQGPLVVCGREDLSRQASLTTITRTLHDCEAYLKGIEAARNAHEAAAPEERVAALREKLAAVRGKARQAATLDASGLSQLSGELAQLKTALRKLFFEARFAALAAKI